MVPVSKVKCVEHLEPVSMVGYGVVKWRYFYEVVVIVIVSRASVYGVGVKVNRIHV